MPNPNIITVGFEGNPGCDDIAGEIRRLGLELSAAEDPDDLSALMDRRRRTAVVIYRGQDPRLTQKILDRLSDGNRRPPVVVLVDESDFSDYYELMGAGASDYYSLSEGAAVIARAVRQAAARA